MASLTDDLSAGSEWISEALRSSGYVADFSPASLWSVDRFLDDHAPAGQPRLGGLLAIDLGTRLFSLGAYTGEVLWRNLGGQWETNDADPEGELNVALTLPVGDVVFPVQRVMKQVQERNRRQRRSLWSGIGPGGWPGSETRKAPSLRTMKARLGRERTVPSVRHRAVETSASSRDDAGSRIRDPFLATVGADLRIAASRLSGRHFSHLVVLGLCRSRREEAVVQNGCVPAPGV